MPTEAALSASVPNLASKGWRIAIGGTTAFCLGEALQWKPTFLAAVIVVQLLAQLPAAPSFSAGLGILASLAAASVTALLIVNTLIDYPLILIIVVGLVLFSLFWLNVQGRAPLLTAFGPILITVLPVIATEAVAAATFFAISLIQAVLIAVAVIWLAFALFPEGTPHPPPRPQETPGAEQAWRIALLDVAIVLPVVIVFLLFDLAHAVVTLVMVVTLVRQQNLEMGKRSAGGLLLGNVLGGIAAIAAYLLIGAVPNFPFLVLTTLIVSLSFTHWLVQKPALAPVFVIGLVTAFILLGGTLSPMQGEPATASVQRLFYVFLATLYIVVAFSLAKPRS